MRRCILLAFLAVALLLTVGEDAVGKGKPLWQFKATRAGDVTGRLDFGVVHRDGVIYSVSAFYSGKEALLHSKKLKPARRSYAELTETGVLGKYKRWDVVGRVERYWMTFVYKGTVKVRYEKGPRAKGVVREVGKAEAVVPLDGGQPQFAFLLASAGTSGREATCVGVAPAVWGTARVEQVGPDEIVLEDDIVEKREVNRWKVTGDCGEYDVYLDQYGQPLVITSGDRRYERFATDLGIPETEVEADEPAKKKADEKDEE